MKIVELVQLAKAKNTEAFGDMPDKRAAAVVRAVLAELNRQIETATGPVSLNGFGRFALREKGRKDGAEAAEGSTAAEASGVRRRIIFRPAAAKKAGEAAGGAAAKKAAPAAKAARKSARIGRKAAAGKKSST